MRILGIDPGSRITGYGCIDADPDTGSVAIVEAGVLRLGGSGATVPLGRRLVELDTDYGELLERLSPKRVAMEGLFAHYKHPATAIVMGHARGVLVLGAARQRIELVEFKPAQIKVAVTGSGRASKDQMQRAVQSIFGLAEPPTPADVADALGAAVCAARRLATEAIG